METEISATSTPNDEFVNLIQRSRGGDHQALSKVVELLEPDIQLLSRTMRMERSDAAQTLRMQLIELILDK
ncbi:helix-turn-helix domain-containing protein [Saccharibacillus sp. JS10]|uniref:helix-turn-helix domain-containing protein n=1 Tax=Saccharibacillus sp. JS10 TaxID=2950552 RepID=UPI00210C0F1D|nr:helix-turn-helix domain-containing protein [Saccharibacillus sp. JS10]MCQ4086446.1 helix-turn-helix domain-containing protein [Saccharibacillus sp. JS10]